MPVESAPKARDPHGIVALAVLLILYAASMGSAAWLYWYATGGPPWQ
jgi:hypothetical protein